jgi:hypothetical protein
VQHAEDVRDVDVVQVQRERVAAGFPHDRGRGRRDLRLARLRRPLLQQPLGIALLRYRTGLESSRRREGLAIARARPLDVIHLQPRFAKRGSEARVRDGAEEDAVERERSVVADLRQRNRLVVLLAAERGQRIEQARRLMARIERLQGGEPRALPRHLLLHGREHPLVRRQRVGRKRGRCRLAPRRQHDA